jgi:hypothetical protein
MVVSQRHAEVREGITREHTGCDELIEDTASLPAKLCQWLKVT